MLPAFHSLCVIILLHRLAAPPLAARQSVQMLVITLTLFVSETDVPVVPHPCGYFYLTYVRGCYLLTPDISLSVP